MFLPYLMFGYAVAALLLLGGLQVAGRAVPGLRGVRTLRWAMLSAIVGVLLLAMRSVAPNWITILCANGAIYACVLFIYKSTAETLDLRARFMPWGLGFTLAALSGQAWFTYVQDDLLARILIASSNMILIAVFTSAMLFRFQEPIDDWICTDWGLRSQTRVLAWVQVANALDHVTRCILSLKFPPSSYVHMDVIQAGFTYMNMLLNVAASCGVIWLALSFHRRVLQKTARTDGLTGLLNRRAFEEILARDLRRCNHEGRSLPVLLLDIDHFKAINDSFGHQVGDRVLCAVSNALRECLRPTDTLCRFGGEEFVMVLHDVSMDQAENIAHRVQKQMSLLEDLPGAVRLTVSIGLAASRPEEPAEELLRRCDEALYRSKRAGRNCVTVDRCLEVEAKGLPSSPPHTIARSFTVRY